MEQLQKLINSKYGIYILAGGAILGGFALFRNRGGSDAPSAPATTGVSAPFAGGGGGGYSTGSGSVADSVSGEIALLNAQTSARGTDLMNQVQAQGLLSEIGTRSAAEIDAIQRNRAMFDLGIYQQKTANDFTLQSKVNEAAFEDARRRGQLAVELSSAEKAANLEYLRGQIELSGLQSRTQTDSQIYAAKREYNFLFSDNGVPVVRTPGMAGTRSAEQQRIAQDRIGSLQKQLDSVNALPSNSATEELKRRIQSQISTELAVNGGTGTNRQFANPSPGVDTTGPGGIRNYAQGSAPYFVEKTPENRFDVIYNAQNRANVDTYNRNAALAGFAVDTGEYINRKAGQDTRDTIREQNKPRNGWDSFVSGFFGTAGQAAGAYVATQTGGTVRPGGGGGTIVFRGGSEIVPGEQGIAGESDAITATLPASNRTPQRATPSYGVVFPGGFVSAGKI